MRNNEWRTLAIDPTSRGFGFVVLEGQRTLVDWGVKATKSDKKSETLAKVTDLIRHYHPRVLIVEDCHANGSRRCLRVKHLLDNIHRLAEREGLKSRKVSLLTVRRVFIAFRARNKHQIAQVIAQQLPELAMRLPRYRKPWMSEDYTVAIFDAAAFALTYYYARQVRWRRRDSVVGGPPPDDESK